MVKVDDNLKLSYSAPMPLSEALALFCRLGVHVEAMSPSDFTLAYFALAKRYHPDRNPKFHELMANINAAGGTIVKSYRRPAP
jgi:DnaJ-class molecular chaperone